MYPYGQRPGAPTILNLVQPLLTEGELNEILNGVAVVLFLSTLLVFANLGERRHGWGVAAYAMLAGPTVILTALSIANFLSVVFFGPGQSHLEPRRLLLSFALEALGGTAAWVSLLPIVRRAVARVLRSFRPDSPVHAVSFGLFWLVLLFLLSIQAQADQLAAISQAAQASLWVGVLTQQGPMVLVAFVGVGLFVRRGPNEARKRLGLVWPGWRWLAASVAIGLALIAFGTAWDNLMAALTPADSKAIDDITSKLILSQLSGVGGAITLALAAGICEELLFRGALVPPFGIVLAALLFAALHAQYALTLATVEIFILGLVLGWLRRRAGTTGAIVAHFVYDGVLLVAAMLYLGR